METAIQELDVILARLRKDAQQALDKAYEYAQPENSDGPVLAAYFRGKHYGISETLAQVETCRNVLAGLA